MTTPGRPLEETSVTQDHDRRREKRIAALLDYLSRMENGRLLVEVRDGAPLWWKQCKDKRRDRDD